MSNHYLDPNDAPWTDEYAESYPRKALKYREDNYSRYWCDENEDEQLDALYGVI